MPDPSDELVICDDLSSCGLRRLHVLRQGSRVGRERWLGMVPPQSVGTLRVVEYHEELLGVWHLRVYWGARELVRFPDRVQPVMLWHLEPGQRFGDAVLQAAFAYWNTCDQAPAQAWLPRLPEQAPRAIELQDGVSLPIGAGEWVPAHCVAVGGEPV